MSEIICRLVHIMLSFHGGGVSMLSEKMNGMDNNCTYDKEIPLFNHLLAKSTEKPFSNVWSLLCLFSNHDTHNKYMSP